MKNLKLGNVLIAEEKMRLANTYLGEEVKPGSQREMIIYRTSSWGGEDGRSLITRDFESLDYALEDALKDTWNDGFRVCRLRLGFNGRIKKIFDGNFIKITCLRELWLNNRLKWNEVPEFDRSEFAKVEANLSEEKKLVKVK